MDFQSQLLKYGLYIGMIGALLGAVGDVLLLYHPEGNYESGDYFFLADIHPHRLLIGAYLGILFIPLEVFGLAVVYDRLKPAIEGKSWIFILSLVFTLFPGVAYHATCGYTGMYLRMAQDLPGAQSEYLLNQFDFIRLFFEPLGALLVIGFLSLSFLYSYLVLKKETQITRWKAYFNPVIIYLFFILIYLLIPDIGNILAPAAFNLSVFLFFLMMVYEK